ncbi:MULTISPECIES: hypothetical protein [Pseudomonas]|uniref:hypothetical protein n=1 Tax=Pseudomonas TaxID=286 RepID=UPI001CE480F6|nr:MULTISPECIES: hypothetical protein [Pseudomonas]MCO7597416.1 hypothetical protein [Pseudomonas guariconensis]MCO7634159.1 hypothetical protein [Pseudomonas guariconensis]MCU7222710.1 hypothetical protein [Pseudomonas brassicacearum]
MSKAAKTPFYIAGAPMIAIGAAFAAVGAAGQPAFGWTAAGLLIPGAVLLIVGAFRNRRRA